MIMSMRLGIGALLAGVVFALPLEADAIGARSDDDGRHIYVGGGVPIIVKTNLATRRVARMDRPQDMIDPWSPTNAPLPSFAAHVAPTRMEEAVDPWGNPMQNTRVPLAVDTTDPWSDK